jgi:hypothetical protein
VKNFNFDSPSLSSKDRFATTNIGYTTAIKFKEREDYKKKMAEDEKHRMKMHK